MSPNEPQEPMDREVSNPSGTAKVPDLVGAALASLRLAPAPATRAPPTACPSGRGAQPRVTVRWHAGFYTTATATSNVTTRS